MGNFTPINKKGKKGSNNKTIFAILSLVIISAGIATGIFLTKTKIKRTVPAKEEFEGLAIKWKSHTNAKGDTATVEVTVTNIADTPPGDPIWNITLEKFRFWCPNYYLLCQAGECGEGDPVLKCPDPEHGITGEGVDESEVIAKIDEGETITRTITQQVGGNGQCGSAQVDFRVKKGGQTYEKTLWGVAYQDQPCVGPTEAPTPTTPPGEPTNTPVPSNTPIPTEAPTETPTPKACHQACSSTSPNCQAGLECRADWCPAGQNCNPVLQCTNPTCPKTTTDDCSCPAEPTYTPTPTNTPNPTAEPTATPTEIILAQNTPTAQAAAPAVTEIPSAGVPVYLKIFSGISLGVLLLGLLL